MPGYRKTLDAGWRFALANDRDAHLSAFDDSGFAAVTIPHDWQIANPRDPYEQQGNSQGFYPRAQTGWYRLSFFAPEAWKGKVARILFDGVQRFSTVFLNGQKVGGRMYGYVPFTVDITRELQYEQENLLAVCVDNSGDYGDRWYSGAGIYRPVTLLVDEPVHIPPYGVYTQNRMENGDAAMDIFVTLQSACAGDVECRLTLCDEKGAAVYAIRKAVPIREGQNTAQWNAVVRHPELWDISRPYRYKLTAEVWDKGVCLSSQSIFTGFRNAYFDGEKGFFLNGRNIKLFGANLHHDGGAALGAAVPLIVWERRLRELKRMGINAVRCSHNPQEARFYDLCDEIGLVVIDEIYDKWVGTRLYFQRLHQSDWQQDLDAMIARDRNHPSIVLWSVGNEVEIQYAGEFYEIAERMCGHVRKADPQRPVSLALIGFCTEGYDDRAPLEKRMDAFMKYAQLVDVVMCNYMEGFYQAMRKAGLNKAVIGSEVFSYYRHMECTSTAVTPRSPWDDMKQNPWVAGGFVWAGIDYLGESQGWPCKGWTGCPMDSTGFLKLRGYHLKSQWTAEPMVKIGVFSEEEPWDMAVNNWSFPQMVGRWRFKDHGRMMHVVVMTNCDEVGLYLNQEPVRRSEPGAEDHMAHFFVPYYAGTLRAEGLRNGVCAAQEVLHTTTAPTEIALSCYEQKVEDLCHVELRLLDEKRQLWEEPGIPAFVLIAGGQIIAADNGDFLAESSRLEFHNGHCLLLISVDDDVCEVSCRTDTLCSQPIIIKKKEV